MAARYLIVGSKFQPFSFAEMTQPLDIYGKEYQRQEDLYNTYSEASGLIGSQLTPEYDSRIIDEIYNPFMQDLSESASELSSKGLSPNSRKRIQNLRTQFNNQIIPIKMAAEARRAAQKKWDEMYSKDQSLMTNANPYYKGVSDYMNGKNPATTYVSGKELYTRGNALGQAFSRTLRDVPKEESDAFYGQYFRIIKQYGPDSNEMQQFMQGALEAIPALQEQVDDIMNNSGIYDKGFTENDIQKAYQWIVEGMKSGLSGNTEVQYLQNRGWNVTPESPSDTPESTIKNAELYSPGITRTIRRKDFNQALADYDAYSGIQRDGTTEENQYVEAEIDGKRMLVPPQLKAMMTDPEEYERAREEYKEQLLKSKTESDSAPQPLLSAYSDIKSQLDSVYPEYSEKNKKRMIERAKERFDTIEKKYDYLTDDSIMNVRYGSRLNMEGTSNKIGYYDMPLNSTDRNNLWKFYDTKANSGLLYPYNYETQTYDARPVRKTSDIVSDKNRSYIIDKFGRVILKSKDKYYYVAGSDVDQNNQKTVEGVIKALRDFSKDNVSSDGMSIPGIGNYKDRPEFAPDILSAVQQNPTLLRDYFGSSLFDYASPIISKGNTIGYKMTVNNSETGIPYNIVFDNQGVVLGMTNIDEISTVDILTERLNKDLVSTLYSANLSNIE